MDAEVHVHLVRGAVHVLVLLAAMATMSDGVGLHIVLEVVTQSA